MSGTAEHAEHKRRLLQRRKRVVIKVGSSILAGTNGIETARVASLAGEIATLHASGLEVLLVTSGAVAAGVTRLGWNVRPRSVPQRQAAAAVGQISLMALYAEHFATAGVTVAQILLTHDDLASRTRYQNARHTIETLLDERVMPIANENDTVVTQELTTFGDNDNLSALIAGLVEADLLVLLSDVDGLYTKNPGEHPDAAFVHVVDVAGAARDDISMDGRGPLGTGGMASKFAAARKAAAAGIPTIIAHGRRSGVLARAVDPDAVEGTLFLPVVDRMARRKHWIAYTLRPAGTLTVDAGGVDAVVRGGRSLLPSGLCGVEGRFETGACVRCVDLDGHEFARGIANYGSAELERIRGLHTTAIEAALGYKRTDEVIHRNDLVLTSA